MVSRLNFLREFARPITTPLHFTQLHSMFSSIFNSCSKFLVLVLESLTCITLFTSLNSGSYFILRRRTTTAQKDPSHMTGKLVGYIMHVPRLNRQFQFPNSSILAMDETPVWNDMVSSTTVDKTGSKDVPLKTTGHEKVRVSVWLAAKGDGRKHKPFVVIAGAKRESKALHEEYKRQCSVASSTNGWMNEELTLRWINEIVGTFAFNKRLLAWDSYEAHMTEDVKLRLKGINTESVIVPGGCTKHIQAPDVVWNKPFKQKVAELYDEWLSNGVHEFTESGNMKPVPRRLVLD